MYPSAFLAFSAIISFFVVFTIEVVIREFRNVDRFWMGFGSVVRRIDCFRCTVTFSPV
jgi:uncharacterized protein HemY